jgi:hypothetical protein
LRFGITDDVERGAVLDRLAGIEELRLAENGAAGRFRRALERISGVLPMASRMLKQEIAFQLGWRCRGQKLTQKWKMTFCKLRDPFVDPWRSETIVSAAPCGKTGEENLWLMFSWIQWMP